MADVDFQRRLSRTDSGAVRATFENAYLCARHTPELAGVIALNEFSGRIEKRAEPPWDSSSPQWIDVDDSRLRLFLFGKFGADFATSTIAEAASVVAHDNRFHPLREQLDSLVWDERPRVRDWLIDIMDADATCKSYLQAVGLKMLIAAVARVYEPGAKVDSMVIFEGKQGIGKSTSIAILAGEFYSDEGFEAAVRGDKDALMAMAGHWLIEAPEFRATSRSTLELTKHFITKRIDRYRRPYAKRIEDIPRQSVFVGTTNRDQYLTDDTGNRRFWPVKLLKPDLASLDRDRDQLWAETVHWYRTGFRWWFDADDEQLALETSERVRSDPWQERVAEYLERQDTLQHVTAPQILDELGVIDARRTHADLGRVGQIMNQIGWIKRRRRINGAKVWVYERPEGGAGGTT